MTLLNDRTVPVVGIVLALLLLGLPFYAGTFMPPYNQNTENYGHEVVAGPSENVTADWETETSASLPELDTYRYTELSPTARELFDHAREVAPSRYTADICGEFLLVCDGYYPNELPEEFTYNEDLSDAELYSVITDGDDEYLLATGSADTHNNPRFDLAAGVLFLRAVLFVYGGFLGAVSVGRIAIDGWRKLETHQYVGLVGAGAVLAVFGFLTPYLVMYGVAGLGTVWATTVFAWLGCLFLSLVLDSGSSGSRMPW